MTEHQPVLLQEVITCLAIKPDGIYIDGTFGRGGHSREILKHLGSKGLLFAIDKDPEAISFAKKFFCNDNRFSIKQGSFTMLQAYLHEHRLSGKVDGILLDLGVSSPQLDDPDRGFSFLRNGPLDMRMDPSKGVSAATWINIASEQEIAEVLRKYGEERYAKRIARSIVKARALHEISTTGELAALIVQAHPAWEKNKHPATRTFQAIRIFINHELDELQNGLEQCLEVLKIGGRLAVISFHSLEDRIVKRFVQEQERGDNYPENLPITQSELRSRMHRIAWGIRASAAELETNPRARSAVLRVAEKLS